MNAEELDALLANPFRQWGVVLGAILLFGFLQKAGQEPFGLLGLLSLAWVLR